MRGAVLLAAAATASIVTVDATSAAQSPFIYPWCRRAPRTDGGVTSCYFASYQQCRTTLPEPGGYCYYNHAYRGHGRLYR